MKRYDLKQNRRPHKFDELIQSARRSGASEVAVMSASHVPVADPLAGLCRETRCEGYGLSPSCPPHVSGPSGFRRLIQKTQYAVVIRIDIPEAVMFSNERNEVLGLVHEVVSSVERAAVRMGYPESKAFAGGSCKNIFCSHHVACRVLSRQGECRNPQYARPSMSGFGIDVGKMLQTAGCAMDATAGGDKTGREAMTWVAGLVMVG